MVAKSFEVGDLVWAKMKGFPPWPGKIIDPPDVSKVKKAHHYVFFYGSENHAWISDENIFLHNDRLVKEYATKKRSASYLSAVETIVDKSKNSTKYQKQLESSFEKFASDDDSPSKFSKSHESFESVKDASPKNKSSHANSVSKKEIKKKVPLKKTPVYKKTTVGKRLLPPDDDAESGGSLSLSPKMPRMDEGEQEKGYKDLYTSLTSNIRDMACMEDASTHNSNAGLLGRSYIDRPKTPEIDLTSENLILKEKKIVPTKQKIGFLGLGGLGKGIVKNLLQSGHSVTIWNRTTAKCDEFVAIGAEKASTPADVISSTDITFCCVSDPDAAKKLVFENCGVLKGLESCTGDNKGFVEMTSMDHETSRTIADQVQLRGGRYLEAPIHGSRVQAEEGSLFVLVAGDQTLYEECKSCFEAISKHTIYLRARIGDAAKLNIIHSMLVGTVYAAVAESLALLKRIDLDPNDFLEILQYGVLDSRMLIQKARSMVKQMYEPNTRLRHIQRYLSLGLSMGSAAEQPMPITAAANEVYKHCKLLRFGDHDVSAVYEGIRGMLDE